MDKFKSYVHAIIFCLLFIGLDNVSAQSFIHKGKTVPPDTARIDSSKLEKLFSRLADRQKMKMEMGKAIFTPFIAPSYSPEMEWLFSVGGLLTFKTDPGDQELERSSIPLSFGISTNGSVMANIRGFIYGKKDKYHISGEFNFKDMPDHYWGVGYEKGRHTEKPDSTAYHRSWYQLKGNFVFKMIPNVYTGLFLDINRSVAAELNPHMANDPNVKKFGKEIHNIGIGLAAQYDSRDLAVNAYKGMFIDFSLVNYNKLIGGENLFWSMNFDFRRYFPLGRPRHTLAVQLKGTQTLGDVPWSDMALLGTPFDLRSYTWGRYRDKAMAVSTVEYRHMFNAPKGSSKFANRHGFVTWAGIGTLAHRVGSFNKFLPSAGIGYRLETQDRMNFRVDYGIGKDANGLYISFSEAF